MKHCPLFCLLFALSAASASAADLPRAVDRDGRHPVPVITAHGHCAWPNLKLLKDGRTLAAVIFNNASHGHRPGDVECWLSGDGGATWQLGSAATQHEPNRAQRDRHFVPFVRQMKQFGGSAPLP